MISAKEIIRQQRRLLEETSNFMKSTVNVDNTLMNFSNLVKSEDSNLSDTAKNFSVSLHNFNIASDKCFNQLASVMLDYANNTLKNEETTDQAINKVNSEINDISQNVKAPEIYTEFE